MFVEVQTRFLQRRQGGLRRMLAVGVIEGNKIALKGCEMDARHGRI